MSDIMIWWIMFTIGVPTVSFPICIALGLLIRPVVYLHIGYMIFAGTYFYLVLRTIG